MNILPLLFGVVHTVKKLNIVTHAEHSGTKWCMHTASTSRGIEMTIKLITVTIKTLVLLSREWINGTGDKVWQIRSCEVHDVYRPFHQGLLDSLQLRPKMPLIWRAKTIFELSGHNKRVFFDGKSFYWPFYSFQKSQYIMKICYL